jgi:hypothetical protein
MGGFTTFCPPTVAQGAFGKKEATHRESEAPSKDEREQSLKQLPLVLAWRFGLAGLALPILIFSERSTAFGGSC